MAGKIKAGAILIEGKALLPDSLWFASERCANGWILVKNLNAIRLGQKIRDAGWTFFSLAGEVKGSALGFDAEKTTSRAIQQVLANGKLQKFNCLEIKEVVLKRFLGLPYVSVSGHRGHIQKGLAPFQSQLSAV